VVIDTVVHILALIFAWTLQMIVSSVTSGLRGGMLASRSFIDFSNERGWSKIDDDQTMLDEAIGVLLAGAGIFFQLANGFRLPLPFNLILLPLIVAEWWLRWQVTW
jgi:uncharacterized protein involved in cysteine biosynthesis